MRISYLIFIVILLMASANGQKGGSEYKEGEKVEEEKEEDKVEESGKGSGKGGGKDAEEGNSNDEETKIDEGNIIDEGECKENIALAAELFNDASVLLRYIEKLRGSKDLPVTDAVNNAFKLFDPLVNFLTVRVDNPVFNDVNFLAPDTSTLLQANDNTTLNSASTETSNQKDQRLAGLVPDNNINQDFDPLDKHAICFNEPYNTNNFETFNQLELYQDYTRIFEWGFANNMGPPLQGVSDNNITINRLPGMFLRMCFHDNAIDPDKSHFQDYIDAFIERDAEGRTRWTGPAQNLETSGADASVLVCSQERFHPNQNDDQTASRVLYSLQSNKIPGIVDRAGNATSMVNKYKLSYADLLHNGGAAAAIFLRPPGIVKKRGDSSSVLAQTPFTFGRRDACRYKWEENTRAPLCGPSELLPSLGLSTKQTSDWFVNRGMTSCQYMALMWTHSTMAPLADQAGSTCPLMKLPCIKDGEKLDYVSHFLKQGKHEVTVTLLDVAPNCEWRDGPNKTWPLSAVDCTLSQDVVDKAVVDFPDDINLKSLKSIIKKFGAKVNPPERVLMCALRMLGGKGNKNDCDDIKDTTCTAIGTNKIIDDHMFGGYFGKR